MENNLQPCPVMEESMVKQKFTLVYLYTSHTVTLPDGSITFVTFGQLAMHDWMFH